MIIMGINNIIIVDNDSINNNNHNDNNIKNNDKNDRTAQATTSSSTQDCLVRRQPDGQGHPQENELAARRAWIGGPGSCR